MTETVPPHTVSAASTLLVPSNCTLLLIDYQPVPFFTVQSMDRQLLINNIVGLGRTAQTFDVPTVLTTVTAVSFDGPMLPDLTALYPDNPPIDRTSNNPWEDERVVSAVRDAGRTKIVMGGFWTGNCLALAALSAREDGYEVYVVADACGDVSAMAHDMAMQRMIQAGVVPITWLAVMLELQRDWARDDTAGKVKEIGKQHGGAMGQAAVYAESMISNPA